MSASWPARIVVISDDATERVVELHDVLTVGRSSKSDIVIDRLDCSRNHAELRRRADGCLELVDLGSRNGCFVNGVRAHGRHPLGDGDRIDIAEVILRVVGPALEPQGRSAAAAALEDEPEERTRGVHSLSAQRPPAACTLPEAARALAETQLLAVVMVAELAPPEVDTSTLQERRSGHATGPELRASLLESWRLDALRSVERWGGSGAPVDLGGLPRERARAALTGYWWVDRPEDPSPEIACALRSVGELVSLAAEAAPILVVPPGGSASASCAPSVSLEIGSVSLESVVLGGAMSFRLSGAPAARAAALCRGAERDRVHLVVSSDLLDAWAALRECARASSHASASDDSDGSGVFELDLQGSMALAVGRGPDPR